MSTKEQNKALATRVKQLEQEKLEAEEKRNNLLVYLMMGTIVGVLFIYSGFTDGGLLRGWIGLDKSKEVETVDSNCRGTASTYVMPFDGKTYTYKCNEATGVWAYTDRFNDPSCNLIKGNIAFESKEKIYHTKGQTYYDDTSIDIEYGERWFCSEQEAINAGWRKSYE